MKKMDSLGLKMCNYQAQLFECSIVATECSSKIFIRRFMYSDLAKRMDCNGFLFDSISLEDAINEIEEQYGRSSYGTEKYTSEELHWIGYIYRYWSYVSGKSSRQIYKIIKPEEMRKIYFPYHSLDPLQAIERITEEMDLGIEDNMYDISTGVRAIRKIRAKYAVLSSRSSLN